MKIKEIKVEVKRSKEYQSVSHEATATLEKEDKEYECRDELFKHLNETTERHLQKIFLEEEEEIEVL